MIAAVPLHQSRACLQEPKILARLGFLYEGYSMAYWETFQMVLKLLLAAVPVFVPAQPYGSTQACQLTQQPVMHPCEANAAWLSMCTAWGLGCDQPEQPSAAREPAGCGLSTLCGVT